jgi:multicomponent Na+:H+ antiporter subunit D
LVLALSLAGVPPLSGFWGKLAILQAATNARSPILAAVIVTGGILTLWSMLRIWNAAFWSEPSGVTVRPMDRRDRHMTAVVALLAAISLAIGLGAEGVMRLANTVAGQVSDPRAYAEAVNGFAGKDQAKGSAP